MPIYGVKVLGEPKERVVRASSAAKARDHVVESKALTAEELADAIGKGAEIETATEAEPDPAPAGDPPAADPGTPAKGK